jgi:PilZ domain-containing protein
MAPRIADIGTPAEFGHNGRREASELPIATTLRFSPQGTVATLINISPNGLLAECPVRLSVGSSVTVQFDGGLPVPSVVSRVARCAVANIGPGGVLRYEVGLAFNTPIVLADPPTPPAAEALVAGEAGEAIEPPASIEPPLGEDRPPVRLNRW